MYINSELLIKLIVKLQSFLSSKIKCLDRLPVAEKVVDSLVWDDVVVV